MAEHERELRVGKLAVEDVQVGAADPAGLDPDPELPRSGLGLGQLRLAQAGPARALSSTIARITGVGYGAAVGRQLCW